MAALVTRCPKCGTSFRVTPGQLKTARGSVRCGSCLHVFNAQQHLISGQGPAKPASPARTSQRPAASAAQRPATANQARAQAPASARPQTPGKPQPSKPQSSKPQAGKAQPASGRPAPHPGQAPAPKPQAPAGKSAPPRDSAWDDDDDFLISDDLDLGGDEPDKDNTQGPERGLSFEGDTLDFDVSDSFKQASAWQPGKGGYANDRHDSDRFDPSADESWALSLLEEEEHGGATRPQATPEKPGSAPPAPGTKAARLAEKQHGKGADSRGRGKPPRTEIGLKAVDDDDVADLLGLDDDGRPLLDNLHAPVELDVDHPLPGKRWLWPGLSALAALLLLVQVAAWQFPTWSRLDNLRPWYAQACDLVGCELPSLTAPEKIRTTNMVVRPHPEIANALLVDLILINTAPFAQPFPKLTLAFSDIQGAPVASRTFSPNEYLGGELAGRDRMPSRQPVHLSLEIVDPGDQAVNYLAAISP